MKFEKTIVWINCWLFVGFGLGFVFFPRNLGDIHHRSTSGYAECDD